MDMPKKLKNVTRRFPRRSATAATTSVLLALVSLLGAFLGVSVGTGSGPAWSKGLAKGQHFPTATVSARKSGEKPVDYKSSLQSNQHRLPTQTPTLQSNILGKGTVGGSTGPTKPPLPTTGTQHR
jgi:hypothetical protein